MEYKFTGNNVDTLSLLPLKNVSLPRQLPHLEAMVGTRPLDPLTVLARVLRALVQLFLGEIL